MKIITHSIRQQIAGILTVAANSRRQSDGFLPQLSLRAGLRLFIALLLGATVLAVATTATAGERQSNEDIARVAEAFIYEQIGKNDPRVLPAAGHLDPRLRLPLCDATLTAFLRPGTRIGSRTAVGVRCSGSQPWKIYVPVDVVVSESVFVARTMLPRGHVLTMDDVTAETRNVSRLVGGYIADPAALLGQRLKHQVMGGKILTPSMLVADTVIKRGQTVTLVVRDSGLYITMSGKALMDGSLNQRIRVENAVSNRIVEGMVRSPEYVEILVN